MNEEEKKLLKMLIKMQSDDIKDAEMLAEYAEKAKSSGHTALAQRFASRAKMRASQYEEDESELREYLKKTKGENAPNSVQSQCLELMLESQQEKYQQVMTRVNAI